MRVDTDSLPFWDRRQAVRATIFSRTDSNDFEHNSVMHVVYEGRAQRNLTHWVWTPHLTG